MEQLFMTTVNLSLAASVLGLVLLGLRALLHTRLPRWVFYLSWVLVAVRLLLPVSLTSAYSFYNLLPAPDTAGSTAQLALVGDSGEVINFPTVQPAQSHDSASPPTVVVAPAPVPIVTILATVWLCGVLLFTGYSVLCYGYTRRRLARGTPLAHCTVGRQQVAVVRCTLFASPVVCGVLRPVVVLPDALTDATATLVLSHECTHIRRRDNLWQGLAALLLYLHWFNPLLWVCHRCFVADMEISCDQAVCRQQEPRTYAATLVELSQQNSNRLAGGFLAFGESFLAERVRAVLRTRRMGVRAVLAVAAVALGLVVVFLTNPSRPQPATTLGSSAAPSLPPATSSVEASPAPAVPDSTAPSSASAAPSQSVSALPPPPAISYHEGNPEWLRVDPASVQAATLIDKENHLAVRIPTQELYRVVQLLNDIEPIHLEGTPEASGNLRLIQLRMASGDKYEYLIYSNALVQGDVAFALDGSGVDSLYERLPQCGRFEEADWGSVVPEWLGYMNPLRISSVAVQAGERQAQLTTQDSATARDTILWLAGELCAVSTTGGSWLGNDPPAAEPALTLTMYFMDSDDSYTLVFYPSISALTIKAQSIDYTLGYDLPREQFDKLVAVITKRMIG